VDRQALAREDVDHVERAEVVAVIDTFVHEIHAPALFAAVGSSGTTRKCAARSFRFSLHGVARVDGKRASINGARPKTGPEDLCSARKVSTPDWAPFGSAQIQIGGAMDESSPIPNPRFFSRLRRRHVVASLRTAE